MARTDLDLIFGEDSKGNTPEERSSTSSVRFVRSQDELAFHTSHATGVTLTAKEALAVFGYERLRDVALEGSAILARDLNEPSRTLRKRRESLGITVEQLAKRTGLEVMVVEAAELRRSRTPIRVLNKIAIGLGLDECSLTFTPGARGDDKLAYRLRSWAESELSTKDRLTFCEASWVIATQQRLQEWLEPEKNPRAEFNPSSNYGSSDYRVYDHADYLAHKTRELLGYGADQPIDSMREVCSRLGIPLIRAELSPTIAGATVANNAMRGIIVNSFTSANNNVLVQRATVAHELGHLLWDPDEELNSLVVDGYDQIEDTRREGGFVEARANAFAVEFLAPKEALRAASTVQVPDRFDIKELGSTLIDRFGLSATAMKFHLWNAFDRVYEREETQFQSTPSEWEGREGYGDYYFPIATTRDLRRGAFAGFVVRAERQGWLTSDTAAEYLNTDVNTYEAKRDNILDMFPVE